MSPRSIRGYGPELTSGFPRPFANLGSNERKNSRVAQVPGIMFHHFSSSRYPARPGALSDSDLDLLLSRLSKTWNILPPDDYFEKVRTKSIGVKDTILTFDDAIKSQFDVARPVLEGHGLKAAFFIPSSVFSESPDPLQLFANFRESAFSSFNSFWRSFLPQAETLYPGTRKALETDFEPGYLREYAFYSLEERRFRYLRDKVLSRFEYHEIMFSLIDAVPTFDQGSVAANLWMGKSDVVRLLEDGHTIGLHSHTHPTAMDDLSVEEQTAEYEKNYSSLQKAFGVRSQSVAHPSGKYSWNTLIILRELGVQVGFTDSPTNHRFGTNLEIPRVDSAEALAALDEKMSPLNLQATGKRRGSEA